MSVPSNLQALFICLLFNLFRDAVHEILIEATETGMMLVEAETGLMDVGGK